MKTKGRFVAKIKLRPNKNHMVSKGFIKTVTFIMLIAVAVFIYYVVSNDGDLLLSGSSEAPKAALSSGKIAKPTGNIDDLTKDLISESVSEQQMVSGEDSDADLVEPDTKVIDEFGQSYNENEF